MKNWLTQPLGRALLPGVAGLLALAASAGAGSAESRFAEGNQAWFAGDHAGAIRCYETIAQREGISPALLLNLARAYQANGDPGRARLNFERARWLTPRHAGIRAGLRELPSDAAGVAEVESPRWTRPFLALSLNEWSWLAAAAWAVCGGLFLTRGLGLRKFPFKSALVVSGLLLAVGLGGIVIRLGQMDRAVVLRDQAAIRVSPYAAAAPVASVEAGNVVSVTGAHGAFVRVRTAQGQSGWMAASEVGRIAVFDGTPPEEAVGARPVAATGSDATDAGSGG